MRKSTVSFIICLSVCCLSVCSQGTLGSYWTVFCEILYLSTFFFQSMSRKFRLDYNLTRITDISRQYLRQFTFFLSCGGAVQCGPWSPPFLRFLDHAQNEAPQSVGLLWKSEMTLKYPAEFFLDKKYFRQNLSRKSKHAFRVQHNF